MDWGKLTDLSAVILLAAAFASATRMGHSRVSQFWLAGWTLIVVHFTFLLPSNTSGVWGTLAADMSLASLACAGLFFIHASVPDCDDPACNRLFAGLLAALVIYVCLLNTEWAPAWLLDVAALLFAVVPLGVAVTSKLHQIQPTRYVVVGLFSSLGVVLLFVQNRPQDGGFIAINALLFTVYFGCCLVFWLTYRFTTTGAVISVAGFLAWSSVFILGPLTYVYEPTVHIENEIWNLPKYIVAIGMILLLLEQQIEHNKHLALHDELTGLPNRRLFRDRLVSSIERSRRAETRSALLIVDLDGFKQVNDSYGHHVGDQLLKNIGSIFTDRVRRTDTVARTGGDEFSIILEEPISRADAEAVSRTLIQRLSESMQVEGNAVAVGASIGIAVYPDDGSNEEALCIAADKHMYSRKRPAKRREKTSVSKSAVVKVPVSAPVPVD